MLHLVLEALQAGEWCWGTSLMATKVYILLKYPMVDTNPKHTQKSPAQEDVHHVSTMSAQRAGEAKEEIPKKDGQTKDGEARVVKARKAP